MKYRVFDGHCDTPVELWMRGESLRKNALAVSLEQAKHFGGYARKRGCRRPLPDGRGRGAGHVGGKDRRFPRYRGCGGHRL